MSYISKFLLTLLISTQIMYYVPNNDLIRIVNFADTEGTKVPTVVKYDGEEDLIDTIWIDDTEGESIMTVFIFDDEDLITIIDFGK